MLRLVALALCAVALPALAAPKPPPLPPLPAFAGWLPLHAQVARGSGWGLPPAQAQALAEYGLSAVERALYTNGRRQVAVTGFYFHDLTGAWGAWTYLRPADARPLRLRAGQADATPEGPWLRQGRWLVQLRPAAGVSLSPSALAALSRALPPAANPQLALPTLLYHLPHGRLQPNSLHYALGPSAFAAFCDWLPASGLGFDHGAEALLAGYLPASAGSPPLQVAILSYPTPTMARTRLTQLAHLPGVQAARSGPLLTLVHTSSAAAAAPLLGSVRYQAQVTIVPPTPVGLDALPGLILGLFVLCGIIIGAAIVLGLISGVVRVLVQRVLPERFHWQRHESLIRLHLE